MSKIFFLILGSAGISGTSPPFQGVSSSLERGSSSAYFSANSPRQLDSSYAPSPISPLGDIYPQSHQNRSFKPESFRNSPRSPPLVAHVEQQRAQSPPGSKHATWATSDEYAHQLRSPRLVGGLDKCSDNSVEPQQKEVLSSLGYTIAHYGENADRNSPEKINLSKSPFQQPYYSASTTTSVTTKKYFENPQVESETNYPLEDNYSVIISHKYFDKVQDEEDRQQKSLQHRYLPEQQNLNSEKTQFEMSRSSEFTLLQNRDSSQFNRFSPIDTTQNVKSPLFQSPQLIHEEASFVRRLAQPQNIYDEIPEATRKNPKHFEKEQAYRETEIQIEKLYRYMDLFFTNINC